MCASIKKKNKVQSQIPVFKTEHFLHAALNMHTLYCLLRRYVALTAMWRSLLSSKLNKRISYLTNKSLLFFQLHVTEQIRKGTELGLLPSFLSSLFELRVRATRQSCGDSSSGTFPELFSKELVQVLLAV